MTTTDGPTPAPVAQQAAPEVRSLTVIHSPPADSPLRVRAPVAALAALVLLGGAARLAALLSDRCLWLDEAMLALNLVGRSPRQLLAPLDYNQGAPVGFLLAVKAFISVFGESEWALRLVPFTASVAGLVGFAWVTRRLLPPHPAVLATALLAMSPQLVSYAAECKQYASDAAVAIGLLAVALGLLEGKGGFALWLTLAVAGAVAVWCSHPATFVLGGIGTGILLHAVVNRDRTRFLASSLVVACWLASFGACHELCLKHLGGNAYLTGYWSDHFMRLPPTQFSDFTWIADHLITFFTTPGGFGGPLIPLGGLAAVLALVGLREFARERWPVAVAFVTPVVLVLIASGLRKYPFGGRLLLFLVPVAVLLVTRGAWTIYEATRERNRFAAVAFLGLLVFASAWQMVDILRRPPRHEQLKPLLEEVRGEMRPGDCVYVDASAVPAFRFYTRTRQLPADAVTLGESPRDDLDRYRAELPRLPGRVWVVFSHPHNQDEAIIRAALDTCGTRERELKQPGAAVWLYRLE